MIYLIKTTMFVEGETPEQDKSIFVLKIGYSRDERGLGRFKDYHDSGFNFRILKYFLGGSYHLENKLHRYFKSYKIPSRSKEWFYYNDDIVNTFSECNSILDLYKLFGASNDTDLEKQEYDSKSDSYKISKELLSNLDKFTHDFPENCCNDNSIFSLLTEISESTTFPERMKLICDNNLGEKSLQLLLDYIPDPLKLYYLVLGPDTCRSFSYIKSRLDKEYEKRINNQGIDKGPRILERFQVGDKLTLFDIKEILREIYTSIGLKRTPKATDLFEYFETKKIKITLNGRRVDGFEILSIRS